MSHRIIKVQAFVVASTLSIAMLLFAAQRHESVATPQFRTVVDLTLPVNPDLQQNTLLIAPAKLGGAWTLDTLPPTRLTGPLVVIEAERKNFAQSESLITMDDVANYERLNGPVPQGAIVLVRSVDQSRRPTLDHEALHGTTEIALPISQSRHGEARAVRADPAFRIQQDPFADRLARHADGEIGVEEDPVPEIERGRGAVAEIGGDHRAHRLRYRRALDQRTHDAVPDRTRAGHAEATARGAQRDARHERA